MSLSRIIATNAHLAKGKSKPTDGMGDRGFITRDNKRSHFCRIVSMKNLFHEKQRVCRYVPRKIEFRTEIVGQLAVSARSFEIAIKVGGASQEGVRPPLQPLASFLFSDPTRNGDRTVVSGTITRFKRVDT
jgi:hypothetical protein